jgi:transcription elongation factor GreA
MKTQMANKQIFLTDEGLHKLEQELEELKTVKRKEVAATIKVALSFGDLSENSEYDEAKNEQAMVEARIAELEAMLKQVVVLDEDDLSTDQVSVGSKVRVVDVEFDEEELYQIVGSTEADPASGRISDESPVGKALLGGKVDDIVEAEVPGGVITFRILEIMK